MKISKKLKLCGIINFLDLSRYYILLFIYVIKTNIQIPYKVFYLLN